MIEIRGFPAGILEVWMTHHCSSSCEHPEQEPGSTGLYVDTDSLQADAHAVVEHLIKNWPSLAPAPSRLTLCVRADNVEGWKLWANRRFSHLSIAVKGSQHLNVPALRQSADIAIATSVMADLLLRRVTHAVVLSDDSDLLPLYVAVRDELGTSSGGDVPFVWAVSGREGSPSFGVEQFFPSGQLHVVRTKGRERARGTPTAAPRPKHGIQNSQEMTPEEWLELAEAALEGARGPSDGK